VLPLWLFLSWTQSGYAEDKKSEQPVPSLIDLETEQVVPDLIDSEPLDAIRIKYGANNEVSFGNELTPTQVQKKPSIITWPTEAGAFYTLIKTDLDCPSRADPKDREWHHWLVVNIPGCEVSKGDTLSEFVGSGPAKRSGLHRYVYLVYKQPGRIKFNEPKLTNTSGDKRSKFSSRNFAKKYKLGDPVAANFYQCQWDSYVPKLYKQLGF